MNPVNKMSRTQQTNSHCRSDNNFVHPRWGCKTAMKPHTRTKRSVAAVTFIVRAYLRVDSSTASSGLFHSTEVKRSAGSWSKNKMISRNLQFGIIRYLPNWVNTRVRLESFVQITQTATRSALHLQNLFGKTHSSKRPALCRTDYQ